MHARSYAAAVVAVVLLGPGIARADPVPAPGSARLAWVRGAGAESCPDNAALSRRVVQGLGRDPFATEAAQSIEVVAAREARQWRAQIFVRDTAGALVGTRELAVEGDDCAPLADVVTVAVTLAIDPDARPRATPVPSPPAPVPQPAPALPPAPAPPPRALPRVGLFVRVVGTWGLLPRIAPGAALGVDAGRTGPVRWLLGAYVFPEVAGQRPGVHASFGLTAVSVGACLDVPTIPRLTLSGCVAGHVGLVHAVLYDLTPVSPGEAPWGAVGVTARVAVNLVGPLVADVTVEGVASLARYRFTLMRDPVPVFEQFPVSVMVAGGLGAQF